MSIHKTASSRLFPGPVAIVGLSLAVAGFTAADEKAIALKDAPAAVQKAVNEQLKGGKLRGLSMEVEKGKTTYEAEMTVNGSDRDVVIDPEGKIVEAEHVVELSTLPEIVRAALAREAGKGSVEKVEEVTRDGVVSYEAVIKEAGKKNREVVVGADGRAVVVG